MTCPYCNATQYVTAHVRKRSTTITLIIIPFIMLGNLFFGPSYITLFALIGLLPLFFIIYPFFVQLSNEEEPLF